MRRKREIEDPNNTWNMQLMAAICNGDTAAADELLLKGAKIDHFAPAIISNFPAIAQNQGCLGNLQSIALKSPAMRSVPATSQSPVDPLNIPIANASSSFEHMPVLPTNPTPTTATKEVGGGGVGSGGAAAAAPFNPAILAYPKSTTLGGAFLGVAPSSSSTGALFSGNNSMNTGGAAAGAAASNAAPNSSPQRGGGGDRMSEADTMPTSGGNRAQQGGSNNNPTAGSSGVNGGGANNGGFNATVVAPKRIVNAAGIDPEDPHANDPAVHVGITPFLAALLHQDIETATWVAQHGGNSKVQFNDGRNGTILHFLVRTDNAALLELVCSNLSTIDDGDTAPTTTATSSSPSSSSSLLNTRDVACGMTPVELALFLHKPEMARVLLMYGCENPFRVLVDGRYTATQRACITGNVQVLQTYLSAGDNIRQKDQVSGETLFHLGILHPPVLDYLVEVCGYLSGGSNTAAATSPTAIPSSSSPTPGQTPTAKGGRSGSPISRPASNGSIKLSAAAARAAAAATAGGGGATVAAETGPPPFGINTAVNARGETPLIFAVKYLCNPSPHLPGLNGATAASPNGHPSTPSSKPADKKAAAAVGAGHSVAHPDPVAAATTAGITAAQDIHQYLGFGQPAMPATFGPIGGAAALEYNANIAQHALVALGVLPAGSQTTAPLYNAGNGILSPDGNNNSSAAPLVLSTVPLGQGTPKSGVDLVDFLITKGADPTGLIPDASRMGMSPLMHAIMAYAPDVIKRFVVDIKVPLAARDCMGSTALHYAVNTSQRGTLELLIHVENPADVNAQDRRGETALHRAAARGNVPAIEILLLIPATDVNIVDAQGRNALHAAVAANQLPSVETLLKRCAFDIGIPVVEKGKKAAPKKGQVLEYLVPQRLIIDTQDTTDKCQTALQIAIENRLDRIIHALVTIGQASVERPSSLMPPVDGFVRGDLPTAWRDIPHSGGTILHEAVLMQNVDLVRLIIESAANVLARNFHDRTALHLACCPESQRRWRHATAPSSSVHNGESCSVNTSVSLEIVSLLINAGALVVDQDTYSLSTPLHIACRSENVDLVRILLDKIVVDATNSIAVPEAKVVPVVESTTGDSSATPPPTLSKPSSATATHEVPEPTALPTPAPLSFPPGTGEERVQNVSEICQNAAQDALIQQRYHDRVDRAVRSALRYAIGIQDFNLRSSLHLTMLGRDSDSSSLINKSMLELPGMASTMGPAATSTLPLLSSIIKKQYENDNGDDGDAANDPSSARLGITRCIMDAIVGDARDNNSGGSSNSTKQAIATSLAIIKELLFQPDFDGCTPLHHLCTASSTALLLAPHKERFFRAQANLLNYVASLLPEDALESALWLTDSRGWTIAHTAVAFSGGNQLLVMTLLEMYRNAPQASSSQPPSDIRAKSMNACSSLKDIKERFAAHSVRAGGEVVVAISSKDAAASAAASAASKSRNIVTHPDAQGRNLILLAADYGRVEMSKLLVRSFKGSH